MSVTATRWSGTSWAFAGAAGLVLVWIVCGPLFDYSNTWQLVINTGTTIVTFLMVFLIQRSQNKDSHALHLKINELLASQKGASNRLLLLEDLSEEELDTLEAHFRKMANIAKSEGSITASHSIEEAESRHRAKAGPPKKRRAPSSRSAASSIARASHG